jgi:hypothetical protein
MSKIDKFFTTWIMIWFFLYSFNLFPYNPKLVLYIAIIVSLIILFTMIYNQVNIYYIISFLIIFTLTKLIPYLLVKNNNYGYEDIYFSCSLFLIYLIYLKIIVGNTYECIHKLYIKNICYGECVPLPIQYMNKIKEWASFII